jgi:trimethylamine--corrinoid protein Co-methyltransferase
MFETRRLPLPVAIGPMAQTGSSAPCTLAGTLTIQHAENLAAACVTQLIHPGTPILYGGACHAFDMRTMQMIFSGPEQALMAAGVTQMAHHCGLGSNANVGLTDSKVLDAQAGFEIGVTLALSVMAGTETFGQFGIAGVDQGGDVDILVFQNEIVEYIERIASGVRVDDDTIAADVIGAVGPGGSFLAEAHTLLHMREELWFPTLLDRQFWQNWEGAGRKDTATRSRERREQLLAEYEPCPLDDDTEREIKKILARGRKLAS